MSRDFYRTNSSSHFGLKGYQSDRSPREDNNYYWSSRIRAQGNYHRGT